MHTFSGKADFKKVDTETTNITHAVRVMLYESCMTMLLIVELNRISMSYCCLSAAFRYEIKYICIMRMHCASCYIFHTIHMYMCICSCVQYTLCMGGLRWNNIIACNSNHMVKDINIKTWISVKQFFFKY